MSAAGLRSTVPDSSFVPSPTSPHHLQQPVSDVVSSVVDDIIKDAVFSASLKKEKDRVQKLINNLVSRVHNEATEAVSSPDAVEAAARPSASSAAAAQQPRSAGVALGDHRLLKIGEQPLTWTQTMDSLTLNIHVPQWVCKNHVSVSFTPGSVVVCIRQDASSPPVLSIDRPLVSQVDTDGCMWALEGMDDQRKLILELEKARVQWWARLFMEDDPADYSVVVPHSQSHSPEEPGAVMANGTAYASGAHEVRKGPISSDRSGHAQEPRTGAQVAKGDESEDARSLEETVAGVVSDMISAAALERNEKAPEDEQQDAPSSPDSISGNVQQKVLTRADLPKIIEQYRENIKKSGPRAGESALQLATFYHHGIGVEHNDAEAARLYRFALESGTLDPSAAFQLGLIYNQGAPGLEPNPSEAVRWWRLSASLGNSVAMFNLGVMYMNGSGCDMDPIMATRWFQQAQALNPQLQPPQFSRAQLEERIATAMKLRKARMKQSLSPEEKQRRKEAALEKVRKVAYGSAAIVALSVTVVAIRYWWRNRL